MLAAGVALIFLACGTNSPTPTTPAAPTPAAPTPVPPASANAAPSVTVAFQGASACTPVSGRPCVLVAAADATDPDGDSLTYRWSGCATGTVRDALCAVTGPGPVEAAVEVSDGHGHTVRATAAGEGRDGLTNLPPTVHVGYITAIGSVTIELLGNVVDPTNGVLCGAQYCLSATASGACRPDVLLNCSCLAGLEADVYRTAETGTCTVAINVKNASGLVGTRTLTFSYPR